MIWHWISHSVIPAYCLKSLCSLIKQSAESNETLPAVRERIPPVDFQNMPQSCPSLWLKPIPSPIQDSLTCLHLNEAPCTHGPSWQRATARMNSSNFGQWCSASWAFLRSSKSQRLGPVWEYHLVAVWKWMYLLASRNLNFLIYWRWMKTSVIPFLDCCGNNMR